MLKTMDPKLAKRMLRQYCEDFNDSQHRILAASSTAAERTRDFKHCKLEQGKKG